MTAPADRAQVLSVTGKACAETTLTPKAVVDMVLENPRVQKILSEMPDTMKVKNWPAGILEGFRNLCRQVRDEVISDNQAA
eukprot:5296799-Pyramimonas_sp.AAC.1